jgi:hypothetical protein
MIYAGSIQVSISSTADVAIGTGAEHDAKRIALNVCARLTSMTKAITVRLDEADHAALKKQAEQLRIRPGTLARMLVHAGLNADASVPGDAAARAALDRRVSQSRKRASADAVALAAEARAALDPNR